MRIMRNIQNDIQRHDKSLAINVTVNITRYTQFYMNFYIEINCQCFILNMYLIK